MREVDSDKLDFSLSKISKKIKQLSTRNNILVNKKAVLKYYYWYVKRLGKSLLRYKSNGK